MLQAAPKDSRPTRDKNLHNAPGATPLIRRFDA